MKRDTNQTYYLLFFLSGFPALLYQIVWQRALFTLYGVNIESVTMIVTVFMLGLGMGSLAGGWLSSRPGIRLLLAFGLIEFSIGTFGAASLWIFHRIGAITAGASTLTTGLVAFALLLVPTMLMGSTLPLLVEHFVRRTGNVGESVGLLYSVNTLGSGVACLAAAFLLMRLFGESGSVHLAVCFNLFVGVSAFVLQRKFPAPARQKDAPSFSNTAADHSLLDRHDPRRRHWLHRPCLRNHLVSPLRLRLRRLGSMLRHAPRLLPARHRLWLLRRS